MKKSQILIFLLLLIADLTVVSLDLEAGEVFCKPLLCIWLLACFALQTRTLHSDLKKWFILALVFSWLGDVLLLFARDHSMFFLLGLSAFLVAHIFYILFFHFVRVRESVKSRWWLVLPVAIYYGILISLLNPYLGDMLLPVRIYGIVISFMLMLALHMVYIKNRQAGMLMLFGAVLFVLSDSILAINKFYQSFETAGVFIMLTYGQAQLFLAMGAINYLLSVGGGREDGKAGSI